MKARREQSKQEVGNNLSDYVLNLLPVVTTLPSLVAISLVKVKIRKFQIVT